MVDRNIVNKLGLTEDNLDEQVSRMFGEKESEYLEEVLQTKVDSRLPGTILKGTIVSRLGDDVIVEVGLKSEGVVDASEFLGDDEIEPGKVIEVLLEDNASESGLILLSKRKADSIKGWETVINTRREGDVVSGRVIRRIKGGLLVDIGVPVFLPASQVDIRKPGDISRFIGKEVECKILKIDVEGRNIVVSRRKLIEEQRKESKEKLLAEIEVGQLRKGVVKNIADFGVFVDLGGLDGLLHISDLSWGRISHPSEVVGIDQEIECAVIGVDKENEKISLGLKQKTASPWENVEQRYPIDARVKGKVVNVMNYGAFVRLEDGIEGLVHISEMSWTKRLSHPGEMVNLGDEIEIVVLGINKEKHEISLGLKQTQTNPWAVAAQKYPAGTVVKAKVVSVTNFGVFVEIEPGIDGMIHISDLSWTKKYSHPSEAVQRGLEVECLVLEVNEEKQRVSLGMKQMTEDPWIRAIPEKYIPGHIIKGKVVKLTNFGAFVELEPNLEGLLHISELADHKIEKPGDVVTVNEEVEVKILKVDPESRKIGLSLRRVQWAAEEKAAEAVQQKPTRGGQSVLSDSDMDRLKSREAVSETSETESDTAEQQAAEAAGSEPDQVRDEKTETSESGEAGEQAILAEEPQPGEAEVENTEASELGETGEQAILAEEPQPGEAEVENTEASELGETGEQAIPAEEPQSSEAEMENTDTAKTTTDDTSGEKMAEESEGTKAEQQVAEAAESEPDQVRDEKIEIPESGEAEMENTDTAETMTDDTSGEKMAEESDGTKAEQPQESMDADGQAEAGSESKKETEDETDS